MIPEGWQAVPKDPTEEMISAAFSQRREKFNSGTTVFEPRDDYRAMLAAAPSPRGGAEVSDQHGYPCKPRKLDELSWFYEQREGLIVVNEPIEGARTTTIKIPWRRLEAAVDRHRALKRKRAKP